MDLLKLSLLLLAFRQRRARSGKEQVELPRQRLLRADPPLLRGLEADLAADASALSKLNSWRLLKLIKIKSARSRLYRSRFLQVNTRWKALAEIYTMHSVAPFLESIIENWGKKNLAKTTPKR